MSLRTKQELEEMRDHLLNIRKRLDEALDHWPPDMDLAALLGHELGYAQHLTEALERHARAVGERRRAAN